MSALLHSQRPCQNADVPICFVFYFFVAVVVVVVVVVFDALLRALAKIFFYFFFIVSPIHPPFTAKLTQLRQPQTKQKKNRKKKRTKAQKKNFFLWKATVTLSARAQPTNSASSGTARFIIWFVNYTNLLVSKKKRNGPSAWTWEEGTVGKREGEGRAHRTAARAGAAWCSGRAAQRVAQPARARRRRFVHG